MSHKRWTIGFIILFVLFLLLFIKFFIVSFNIQDSVQQLMSTSNSPSAPKHVVLVSQELDNPYWRTIEEGARVAAEEHNIQLQYTGPIRINQEEQLEFLDQAIAEKVDGIIIQGANNPLFDALVKKASANNIPVITVDSDAPDTERITYVGTDNFGAGKKLGELTVELLGEKGEVGFIIGSDTAENHNQRLEGFLSVLENYPNIEVVDIQTSNISQIQAEQQAEKMLMQYPTIDAMVGTSALDGFGIVQAMEKVKREDIKVIGFDDVEGTKAAIQQGEIDATIVQRPYNMGYTSIELLADYFDGMQIQSRNFTEVKIVNIDNVVEWDDDHSN
ncbi:sugar-binding protein [Caldibacillus lycopersici]|uniref:Sugar-binding protein n=1 Tax=Perspicuibacillus lycopersici TaxID=1325689 RepID=A0AAE3LPV4_9BACI|nr:sugar-binding protein [Perspicuibacillus lycopersici]MCU9612714.1 sugar-binding protein [Perspicuibacillus lycopersici]